MNEFDRIAGYESIKSEIEEICALFKAEKTYRQKGIKIPKGILLYGAPGIGKTLFAECFAKESGYPFLLCRKDGDQSDFIGRIVEFFDKAEKQAPAVLILDDLDKYATGDDREKNAEEYVVVQTCIDKSREKGVFVFATANDTHSLPDSLFRAGRFDHVFEVRAPERVDVEKILAHYLDGKKGADVDIFAFSKLLCGKNCAEIEQITNDAAIRAFQRGGEEINKEDMIRASVRSIYRSPRTIVDDVREGTSYDERVAYHEAGHVVVAEILEPSSVTMVSLGNYEGLIRGFTARYYQSEYWKNADLIEKDLSILLAGKCAIELTYGTADPLCESDLQAASDVARSFVSVFAAKGFQSYNSGYASSSIQRMIAERETNGVMEVAYERAKKIIAENRDFLEAIAKQLIDKKLLLEEDVQRIKIGQGG